MRVYLATPYSHKDMAVMVERFEAVNLAAAKLLAQGINVYSPISHTHPIAMAAPDMPNTWDFWAEFDKEFLEWADELWVLMQDGWDKSVGVRAEIELATGMGKPIKYICTGCCKEDAFKLRRLPPHRAEVIAHLL